jgi:hypothetical protein
MNFPSYQSIDLTTTKLKWGYYVPALIEQYRADVRLIGIHVDPAQTCDLHGNLLHSHEEVNYSWLPHKIEQAFRFKKKIGLLIEDEHVCAYPNEQLIDIVNYYQDRPVYWLTQYDQNSIDTHYRVGHRLQCKILEFPWLILNECLMYNKFRPLPTSVPVPNNRTDYRDQPTFFTLTGRYEPFRKRLLEKLIEHNLHRHGLLTVQNGAYTDRDHSLNPYVTFETRPPYDDQPIKTQAKMAAQFLENNMWIGNNTQNFLHIEQTYQHYPMTIIPETSVYNYFATEKSVWPILLGKLFLIFGSTGCMKYIQRFYDIDLSEFLNLEFDDMDSYADQYIDQKLDCMLESNKNFILNSHKFYTQNYQRIHNARRTLGPNLYRFVLDQVARIQ